MAPLTNLPAASIRRPIKALSLFVGGSRVSVGYISQKTKLAEAIRYDLSRWDGLSRFIDEGRIEIDSNTVERSIRPIAGPKSLRTTWHDLISEAKGAAFSPVLLRQDHGSTPVFISTGPQVLTALGGIHNS